MAVASILDLSLVLSMVLLIFFVGVLIVSFSSTFCSLATEPWIIGVAAYICNDPSRFCAATFILCGFLAFALSLAYLGTRGKEDE